MRSEYKQQGGLAGVWCVGLEISYAQVPKCSTLLLNMLNKEILKLKIVPSHEEAFHLPAKKGHASLHPSRNCTLSARSFQFTVGDNLSMQQVLNAFPFQWNEFIGKIILPSTRQSIINPPMEGAIIYT